MPGGKYGINPHTQLIAGIRREGTPRLLLHQRLHGPDQVTQGLGAEVAVGLDVLIMRRLLTVFKGVIDAPMTTLPV
jgi:hypothetical protein